MDSALSHWLGLREAADWASRSAPLTRRIIDHLPAEGAVHALDLGTGTGSNVRFLATRLPRVQRWLAVDRDDTLLAEVIARMAQWGAAFGDVAPTDAGGCHIRGGRLDCRIDTRCADLHALDDDAIFAGRHLVTASALLDLVSEPWLRALAARCKAVGAAALFTITYDGRSSCTPAEPEDDVVRELMNRHQHRDKGLGGPAEGPGATACAERCFTDAGFLVQTEPSDWRLGPGDEALQRLLIEGWAHAATETAPERAGLIADWLARRLAHVDAGRSRVIVGHHDLAAWLPRR